MAHFVLALDFFFTSSADVIGRSEVTERLKDEARKTTFKA